MSEGVPQKKSISEVLNLQGALNRAIGGGSAGAIAMGIQVCSLMWLRTTMNYQYRHGTSTKEALVKLYKEGGVRRFYRGLGPALFQGPLSRFGDTAANSAAMALFETEELKNTPVLVKTIVGSVTASLWRICLMPIDTTKTILQVEGKDGLKVLRGKYKVGGVRVFWYGSLGAASATLVGHFPWYSTYNLLGKYIPEVEGTWGKLGRRAFIGFCSSFVSDCISNSIRVLKTYRQTHSEIIPYKQAFQEVIAKDGIIGLMGRGLKTRILANGLQGCLFSVLWKGIEDVLVNKYKL
eukprot:TRINITY_DN309_c0_g1_i1.p1 TRINITY_DN309_c0_g1~~TRINITY_DN309_c0_g1_i1.p1  ORF type:complete len:294 (-),score=60.88 TRINITY_DN309_c0_g1_i1:21-902(-)